ncbi:MAG: ATPase domain-containing protein [Ignisphaera sp.]
MSIKVRAHISHIKEEPEVEREEAEKKVIQRFRTGVQKLDEAIEGGIPYGSWILISGEPGTGKTVLTQHAVHSAINQGWGAIVVSTELRKWEWMAQCRTLSIQIDEQSIIKLEDLVEYRVTRNKEGEEEFEITYAFDKVPSNFKIIFIDVYTLSYLARMKKRQEETTGKKGKWYSYLDSSVLSLGIELGMRAFSKDPSKSTEPKNPILIVIDSLSMFYLKAPSMAGKIALDIALRFKKYNTIGLLTSQYAWTTRATYGARVEHVADGVIHMWMDNVESTKEIRRYLIIKKMRMTQHALKAFRVRIEKGKGLVLEELSQ